MYLISQFFQDFMQLGMVGCPETSVTGYHSTLRNILEDRRYHSQPSGSLKSRTSYLISYLVNLACII